MPEEKYMFGRIEFRTKKEVQAYVQKNMLHNIGKYPDGSSVNSDDFIFLMDLLKNHHDPSRKENIKDIFIQKNQRFKNNSRLFVIIKKNGEYQDFSYVKCIYKTEDIHFRRLMQACREAVYDDIYRFKTKEFIEGMTCPLSGKKLYWDNTHVDHKNILFHHIVHNFLKEHNLSENEIEIEHIDLTTRRHNKRIKNKLLREKFRNYHNKVATLQFLEEKENLKKQKIY